MTTAKTIRINRDKSGYWLTPTVGPGACYVPGGYSLATLQSRRRSLQKALDAYRRSERPALEEIAYLQRTITVVNAAISEYQEEIS